MKILKINDSDRWWKLITDVQTNTDKYGPDKVKGAIQRLAYILSRITNEYNDSSVYVCRQYAQLRALPDYGNAPDNLRRMFDRMTEKAQALNDVAAEIGKIDILADQFDELLDVLNVLLGEYAHIWLPELSKEK